MWGRGLTGIGIVRIGSRFIMILRECVVCCLFCLMSVLHVVMYHVVLDCHKYQILVHG